MIWQQVLGSSNVDAIRYDAAKQECYVRFHDGSVYVYEVVGPGMWEEFQHSSSKGRFVQIQLRRAHTARKVVDDGDNSSSGEESAGSTGQDTGKLPYGY